MIKKTALLAALAVAAAFLSSCNRNTATVSGQFIGHESEQVILEKVTVMSSSPADSVMTDDRGYFKFRVELPNSQAAVYNLKIRNETIPLFLSPGEKAKVTVLYGNTRNYIVEGSTESALVKEVNDILTGGSYRLDSIARALSLYDNAASGKREGLQEYTREYHRIKRDHIRFIVTNSGSLAAVYALYQRLPGDEVLFNGDSDIVYYRMVADSVEKYHPGSPYLQTLRTAIGDFESGQRLLAHINEQMENPLPFPEINMPDIYNVRRKLSDELGKVILLDFWVAGEPRSAVVNAEYRELYDRYSKHGFEIYQVNAGESKPIWVNSVLDQKLPWISVSDLRAGASPALLNYNVRELPANFLISTGGDIVGRNLYGDALEKELGRLMR